MKERTIHIKQLIARLPRCQTVAVPEDWYDEVPDGSSVFNSLYRWMVETRRVPADGSANLHNRTYAGHTIAKSLRAAESRRLAKRSKLHGPRLEKALNWSDLNSGPQTLFAGHLVLGDVLLIVPDEEAVERLKTQLHLESTNAANEKIRSQASGASFREWLIANIERDDPTGDIATDVLNDKNFPDADHYHDARRHLERARASAAARRALEEAWLAYASQYPERIHGIAWCDLCDESIAEPSDGVLVWAEDEGLRSIHYSCLHDDTVANEPLHVLLDPKDGRERLVDFASRHAIPSEYMAELDRLLHLWGFYRSRSAARARVYFIQSGFAGAIKIGYSTNPIQQRLAALQTGQAEKLRILAELEGDRELEAKLHRKFANCRISGEWFRPDPELIGFIAVLQRTCEDEK